MGWFNYYRYRQGVDWPCKPEYSSAAPELGCRVRLTVVVVTLVATALIVALALLLWG